MRTSSSTDPTSSRDALSAALLAWFDHGHRDMPWRHTKDPYAIWLSETMLQQTQVETVKPYYYKFLQAFPTVADLAKADLQEVLKLWAGLGYYRRAKHLHAAAQAMLQQHGGRVPPTAAQLLELPGVGRYTAGAVASIAFDEPVPVLDGNVMRVLSRLALVDTDLSRPQTQKRLWSIAETLVPKKRPGDYNQALMELGALVCTPLHPKCMLCPLHSFCGAFRQHRQHELPKKAPKRPVPAYRFLLFLLTDPHGRLLVLQRPRGGLWEEMWEFPVLKTPLSVNSLASLADVVSEALAIAVVLDRELGLVAHTLTHRRMEYQVYAGHCPATSPLPVRLPPCPDGSQCYQSARWVDPSEHAGVPMAIAMKKVLTMLPNR